MCLNICWPSAICTLHNTVCGVYAMSMYSEQEAACPYLVISVPSPKE